MKGEQSSEPKDRKLGVAGVLPGQKQHTVIFSKDVYEQYKCLLDETLPEINFLHFRANVFYCIDQETGRGGGN
jgi:hypothetical protein